MPEPLHIDEQAEEAHRAALNWDQRFVRWLNRQCPWLTSYEEFPRGRALVEAQLKASANSQRKRGRPPA